VPVMEKETPLFRVTDWVMASAPAVVTGRNRQARGRGSRSRQDLGWGWGLPGLVAALAREVTARVMQQVKVKAPLAEAGWSRRPANSFGWWCGSDGKCGVEA
jgi:hypothetical protein